MKRSSPGRGHFDSVEIRGNTEILEGWILNPDTPTTTISVLVDGKLREQQPPRIREEIHTVFPWIPHAASSAFRFEIPRPGKPVPVEVVARNGEKRIVTIRTTLSPHFDDLPLPPPELMKRVTGWPNPHLFNADGMRSYTEFVDAVSGFRPLTSFPKMLDWGCGCGRIARFFLRTPSGPDVFGCDIDGDAIAWAAQCLSPGRFTTINPFPPTPYEDGSFPLVIAYSVFTHLTREMQDAWLAEMRRIISPGGLFLASVHGPFAARFAFPPQTLTKITDRVRTFVRGWRYQPFLADGFFDSGEDHALDGIAPEGYYRGVFQTPAWTRREWSKHFRILEIREGGMQNYQDLVIMERT